MRPRTLASVTGIASTGPWAGPWFVLGSGRVASKVERLRKSCWLSLQSPAIKHQSTPADQATRSLQCHLDPGDDHPACPAAGGRRGPGTVHESLPNDNKISYSMNMSDIYLLYNRYILGIIMSYDDICRIHVVTMSQTLCTCYVLVTLRIILIYNCLMTGIYQYNS